MFTVTPTLEICPRGEAVQVFTIEYGFGFVDKSVNIFQTYKDFVNRCV
jgi:hypothetical protein